MESSLSLGTNALVKMLRFGCSFVIQNDSVSSQKYTCLADINLKKYGFIDSFLIGVLKQILNRNFEALFRK